jgi:hypothetical protein
MCKPERAWIPLGFAAIMPGIMFQTLGQPNLEFVIKAWFVMSGVGIITGFFPALFWCSALVINSAVREGKNVPDWLRQCAVGYSGLLPKASWIPINKIISILLILVFLIGYHYVALVDYATGSLARILVIETSFPVFLLVTWLMPAKFLKRFLDKLDNGLSQGSKQKGQHQKRNAIYFLAMIICAIVFTSYLGNWHIDVFNAIILGGLLILSVVVAIKKFNNKP